ncbi:MAG: hypothetical protein H5U22_05070 [Rhizobium sp.]|nr:hypothetical protein [Rhizobium sp.]
MILEFRLDEETRTMQSCPLLCKRKIAAIGDFRPALQKCEDANYYARSAIDRRCGLRMRRIGRMLPRRVVPPFSLAECDAAGLGENGLPHLAAVLPRCGAL